jgi:hypothetical protein
MEIRCSGCNKLFRIPDEKITGKGIKFACTRCGESVKVTKEEFEQYTLSKSAVSVLDLFEEKPKPAKAPLPDETGKTVTEETALAEQKHERSEPAASPLMPEGHSLPVEEHPTVAEPTAIPETKEFEHTTPPAPESPKDQQPQQSGESVPPSEPLSAAEIKSEPVPSHEPAPALEDNAKREDEHVLPAEPTREPQPPQQQPILEPEKTPLAEPAQAIKPAIAEPKAVRPPESEQGSESIGRPQPADAARVSLAPPGTQQHAPSSTYAPPVRGKGPQTASETPSRTMNMFLVYSVMLILIGLVGYGVFMFIGPGNQKTDELLKELSSTEGLHITTATGSVDPNGDLVISCIVENALKKERPVWYVVVDVYNAQGSVLSKIRAINGKQLYTQRDYDILSKRGVNIEELKAKNLQDHGVVIPPTASVTFQIRYLQPANGVTSFNALVHPFDPVRLFKELAEEIQQ